MQSCTLFSQTAFNTDYIHVTVPSLKVLTGLWRNWVWGWLFPIDFHFGVSLFSITLLFVNISSVLSSC